MVGGCSDRTGAGTAAKEKPATACGKTEEPCPLSQKTKPYYVELRVVTRAGEISIKGVRASVDGNRLGLSDEEGKFKTVDKINRAKLEKASFMIEATYQNANAKLKLERMQFDLTDVDPETGTRKGDVSNEIAKIQDVAGGADIDFINNYKVSDKPEELVWASSKDGPVLKVTVKMATFSLQVPYVNQRCSSDTVETIKGKDPEPATHSHRVRPAFSGDILCYPTCALMLLKYWGVNNKTRGDIMQQIYKQWANKGFPGRLDKVENLVPASTAPLAVSYPDDRFWLDSSTLHPNKGYIVRKSEWTGDWRDSTAFTWELVPAFSGTPDHVGRTPPAGATEGRIWRDTSGGIKSLLHPIFKISRHPPPDYEGLEPPSDDDMPDEGAVWKNLSSANPEFKRWVPRLVSPWPKHPERKWRVCKNGHKVWTFGYREEKALEVFKSAGTSTKQDSLPNKINLFTGPYLGQMRDILVKGFPFIIGTTATSSGHIMLARGCVVDKDCKVKWLILNDPYGNLASPGSIYEDIDIVGAVGQHKRGRPAPNNPDDVEAVQEVLKATGDYKGAVNGTCSGGRRDPLVKAIRRFQKRKRLAPRDGRVDPGGRTETRMNRVDFSSYDGPDHKKKEKEKNAAGTVGEATMRGKHVYYNKDTHGKRDRLELKGGSGFLRLIKNTDFTKAQIAQKLVPGA